MSPDKLSPTASNGNPATATAEAPSPPAAQSVRQQATIRYVDRADMAETFVDSITGLIFDGQTLRIEFGVTRLDEIKANTPSPGAAIRPAGLCCRRPLRLTLSIACSKSRRRSRRRAW